MEEGYQDHASKRYSTWLSSLFIVSGAPSIGYLDKGTFFHLSSLSRFGSQLLQRFFCPSVVAQIICTCTRSSVADRGDFICSIATIVKKQHALGPLILVLRHIIDCRFHDAIMSPWSDNPIATY